MKVFILVNAEVGKAKQVFGEIKKICPESYPLFGEFDFIVITEAKDLKTATSFILEKIQAIKGVTRTRTLVGAEV